MQQKLNTNYKMQLVQLLDVVEIVAGSHCLLNEIRVCSAVSDLSFASISCEVGASRKYNI